ncbi:MAG: FtsW/RodA/SpoVE family cell cycle protein [Planctomycetota bacterium]
MILDRRTRLESLRALLAGFPVVVWLQALLLSGLGLVFIHSATLYVEDGSGATARQALALVFVPGLAAALAYLGRRRVLDLAPVLYVLVLLMLVALLFYGAKINGARRWFRLGPLSLQPSEFVKPALILMLARLLRFETEGRLLRGLIVPLGLTLVPMLLMARQPDLGSALALLPVTLAMAWVGGVRGRNLAVVVLGFAVLTFVLFPFLHGYQKERILVWLDQAHMTGTQAHGAGYHLQQSLIAVGSGGVFGDGLFEGIQNRYDFLPYRETDFLFSVVAEETGLLGGGLLVLLYSGLCIAIFWLGAGIRDRFGRLIAAGVGVYFLTHLAIHVGVTTGLLPTTGLPLPRLSYGRSSTTAAWLALALFAHALVHRERNLSRDRYL